jgi:hypothetical protein
MDPKTKLFLGSINADQTRKENIRLLLPMNMEKKSLSSISMSRSKEEWISGKL